MKRAVLLDYGVGNIHSIRKAFAVSGADLEIASDPKAIEAAPALVLPGVGGFGAVSTMIAPVREVLRRRLEAGVPAFCVCIGMQILYDASEEGPGAGVGFLPGLVKRLLHRRLPHIGWNTVRHPGTGIFDGAAPTASYYFVHSFAPSACGDGVVAEADYGGRFAAAVRKANTWAVQFHPEKSGEAGLRLIRNFVDSL